MRIREMDQCDRCGLWFPEGHVSGESCKCLHCETDGLLDNPVCGSETRVEAVLDLLYSLAVDWVKGPRTQSLAREVASLTPNEQWQFHAACYALYCGTGPQTLADDGEPPDQPRYLPSWVEPLLWWLFGLAIGCAFTLWLATGERIG